MAYSGNPNFVESQVEFVIQAILMARFGLFGPVVMIVPDEQKTGADGYVKGVYPLFMQFKRSSWIKKGYRGTVLPILKDRKTKKVKGQDSALFFKLRDKSKKRAPDFQHNILFKLDQKLLTKTIGAKQGRAVYVAPLSIHRGSYIRGAIRACVAGIWQTGFGISPNIPFLKKPLSIMGKMVGHIPMVDNHVCFPPTSTVPNADHYYSYSTKGEDIVFHSPEMVFPGRSSLGTWLNWHIETMSNPDSLFSMPELDVQMTEFLAMYADPESLQEFKEEHSDLSPTALAAVYLREEFRIEMFLFAPKETLHNYVARVLEVSPA